MNEAKQRKFSKHRSTNPFLGRRCLVALIILFLGVLGVLVFLHQTREIEIYRTPDPTGKYVVIVSHERWQKPFATTPGNSGSHSGYIRIETVDGKDLGKAQLPILWMASDMRWREDGATLVGSGVWDFKGGKFESWD